MSSTEGHHLVPAKYYVGVFIALVFFTVVTVYTAKNVDLGIFNFPLAMAIAAVKAGLVIAIFMGLRWDVDKSNIMSLVVTGLFLIIFFGLVLADYLTRSTVIEEEGDYDEETIYSPIVKGVKGTDDTAGRFMSFQQLRELRQQLLEGQVPEEVLKSQK